MQRALRFSVAAVAAVLITVSCQQPVTMFTKCEVPDSGDPTGTDGTYLLICEDGIWQPVMTLDEFVLTWQGKSPVIGPLPTSTTTTTTSTTSTSSTTSTTTTTVPPAATFAIAYSNVDGAPGFDADAGDRLIAKLVDTNRDDVVSIGDTMTFSEYPVDGAMSSFLSFTNTTHVLNNVFSATATDVSVNLAAGTTVQFRDDATSERLTEGVIDDDIYLLDRQTSGTGNIYVSGFGPIGGTSVNSGAVGDGTNNDYLEIDITL